MGSFQASKAHGMRKDSPPEPLGGPPRIRDGSSADRAANSTMNEANDNAYFQAANMSLFPEHRTNTLRLGIY